MSGMSDRERVCLQTRSAVPGTTNANSYYYLERKREARGACVHLPRGETRAITTQPPSSPHLSARPLHPLTPLNLHVDGVLQKAEPLTLPIQRRSGLPSRAKAKPPAERFWSRVIKGDSNGCWPWTGSRTRSGYGQFKYRGKPRPAHRVGWELTQAPYRRAATSTLATTQAV
jgi:hypothetical protein